MFRDNIINVARILYPVRVLGPGARVGIWFAGCDHHCKGCSNPELWIPKKEYEISKEKVLSLIYAIKETKVIDGFTLTGGDPFFQPDSLRDLLPELNMICEDIMVYTGYSYEFLQHEYPDILQHIAVLIDGPYIEERNNGTVLRGSDNQRIIFLKNFNDKYKLVLDAGINEIQNFKTRDAVISVGIHRKGYLEELQKQIVKRGLEEDGTIHSEMA